MASLKYNNYVYTSTIKCSKSHKSSWRASLEVSTRVSFVSDRFRVTSTLNHGGKRLNAREW